MLKWRLRQVDDGLFVYEGTIRGFGYSVDLVPLGRLRVAIALARQSKRSMTYSALLQSRGSWKGSKRYGRKET